MYTQAVRVADGLQEEAVLLHTLNVEGVVNAAHLHAVGDLM